MKRMIQTGIMLALMAGIVHASTNFWSGGENNEMGYYLNWSLQDRNTPNSHTDCIVNNNNGFNGAGNWIIQLSSAGYFKSLNFSAAGDIGTLNIGRLAIRAGEGGTSIFDPPADGKFIMNGDMVFSGSSLTKDITLQGTSTSSLGYRTSGVNNSIINNTTAILKFGETNGFRFIGYSDTIINFGGSGDIELGPTCSVGRGDFAKVTDGLHTDPDYTGTLTIRNGVQILLDNEVRCQGGTMKIEGSNIINDDVSLGFGGAGGAKIDISGFSDTIRWLENFSSGNVTLRVDGDTDVVFSDFRLGTNAINNAVNINIVGWEDGQSHIIFTDLGSQHYADKYATNWFGVYPDPGSAGPVSNNAVFNYLTIDGGEACMVAYDDGTTSGYAVSSLQAAENTFEIWATDLGLDGAPGADYDSDGLTDYQEYALNGDPKHGQSAIPTRCASSDTNFVYVYAARNDDDSIVYTLVDTPDLVSGPFATNSYNSRVVGSVVATNYNWITNTYDTTGMSGEFIKLIVE